MRLILKLLTSLFLILILVSHADAKGKDEHPHTFTSVTPQLIDSLNEAAFIAKRSSIDSALKILSKASRLALENNYDKGLATSYFYEAGIYQQFGYSKKALTLYYKALELSRASGDTLNEARSNQQIANALFDRGNYAQAEKLFSSAMRSYLALGREDDMVNITNSLGLLHMDQKHFGSATDYFIEALNISKENNYSYGLKKAYYHLGVINLKQHKYDVAKKYLKLALEIDGQRNDRYGLALSMDKLAEVAIEEKKYLTAIKWANNAFEHAQAIGATELEIDAIKNIIEVYKSQKNLPEQAKWQEEIIIRQNKQALEEKGHATNFLELLKRKHDEQLIYEKSALKARQKAELVYTVLLVVCLGLALISILAVMWYKNYKKARAYGHVLQAKNEEIQRNAIVLNKLNETISHQNKSLEENNQMKDKLFSIVSHDLRTPLGGVKSILKLTKEGILTKEETQHILNMLDKEVDVVMDMLNNLLDWSKAQLSGAEVNLEPVDLHKLTEDNLTLISSQAKLKHIFIENSVSAGNLVMTDRERLNFVVRNLLTNAVKFTFKGGYINIHSKEEQDKLILNVSDNGKGIAEHEIKKLFVNNEHFTTVGTAKEKGTGLGLKLCNDFIQSIGGSITVKSDAGKGSTFSIVLPKNKLSNYYQAQTA